jgi:hypothetical protein
MGRVDAGGDLDDQVHLAALGLKPRPVLWGTVQVHVVERVDSEAVALVHDFADLVRGVPLLHDDPEVVVVMGEAVKRVASQNHPADLDVAKFHPGDLDFGSRPQRRGGTLRRPVLGLRRGGLLRSQRGSGASQSGRQGRASVQKPTTRVRHDDNLPSN